MPFTRVELDSAGCAEPGCNHDHSILYFASRCHTGAPLDIAYIKATGTLRLTCIECEQVTAEILVAKDLNS